MNHKPMHALIAVGLALGLSGVQAQSVQPGWYLGGSWGSSKIEPKLDNYKLAGSQDTRSGGYKVSAGYQFNPTWAAELQYQELGKWSYSEATQTLEAKVSGWGFAGLARLPLADRFSLIGKVGLMDQSFNVSGKTTAGGSQSKSIRKTTPLIGAGVEYSLSPALALRAEYEYFGVPTLAESGNQKIKAYTSLLSVGLQYRF